MIKRPEILGQLADVDVSDRGTSTDGYSLIWDDASQTFKLSNVSGGGGVSSLNDLTDVTIATGEPTDKQLLQFDATTGVDAWVPISNLDLGTHQLTGVSLLQIYPSAPASLYTFLSSHLVRIRRNGDAGIAINTGSANLGEIAFADAARYGRIVYDHSTDTMGFYTSATLNFYINSSGSPFFPNARLNTGVTAARFTASGELTANPSSRRFKKNERRLDFDPVEVILALPEPVYFDYIDSVFIDPETKLETRVEGEKGVWGWIAEDMIGTPAERLISKDRDLSAYGIHDGGRLFSLMVETIKRLESRIRKLEGR